MSKTDRYNQFTADMEKAGFDLDEYSSRSKFFEGSSVPAVKVLESELPEVLQATQVKVTWEPIGNEGVAVYPL